MKKFLLLTLSALLALPAIAQDFTFEYEGQTLNYTILDEDAKICQVKAGGVIDGQGWVAGNPYVEGELVIPSKVTYGEDSYEVTSIGEYAFYQCNSLTSVTIPSSVTEIGGYTFYECYSLAEVTIPDGVTEIAEYTFLSCKSLTKVTIPEGVTAIGGSAFARCNSLMSVTIPSSVTEIGDFAFRGCSSLTEVTIPSSVTSIGDFAFYDCFRLTSVTISEGVTSIGGYAFSRCSSLTSVVIPESVTYIGDWAFLYCDSLEKAEFASIEALCKIKFGGTYANPLCSAHNLYINGELVTEVVIPESITSIGECTFFSCTSLTSVTIPESVTSIGWSAFERCENLNTVNIPGSVTEIGNWAFKHCWILSTITLPEGLASIGYEAFSDCRDLTSIYYGSNEPVSGYVETFSDVTYENATLYMSADGVALASGIDPWKNFKNIVAHEFSGIEEITSDFEAEKPYEVYNLNGVKVGSSFDGLTPGLYIVRQGKIVKKITVK